MRMLVGLALAAFELLPFGELIRNSSRESIPLEIYKKAAPPFVIAIQAVISDFFGNPVDKNYWFNQGAELLGRGNTFGAPWSFNYSGENLFSGIIPLFLAAIALFKSRSALTLFFSSYCLLHSAFYLVRLFWIAVYYLIPTFRFSAAGSRDHCLYALHVSPCCCRLSFFALIRIHQTRLMVNGLPPLLEFLLC